MTLSVHEINLIETVKDSVLQLDVGKAPLEQKTPEGVWYVISDSKQKYYFRCNKKVYDFIHLFKGDKTLAVILEDVDSANLAENHNVEELYAVVIKLLNMGILRNSDKKIKNKHWMASLRQPMAIKIPLFNPEALLERLSFLGRFLLSRQFMMVFVLLLSYSISLVAVHWSDLQSHWDSRFFDPINIVYMLIIYPVLKALHELGHGLVLQYFGGKAKECGIVFLVLMPLPYVNTSSSYLFPYKYQRVLVGLAGMLIELCMAIFALIVWCNIDNVGFLSDILFDIFFIGSFSTLIFNLNPLMKFDGYYILSDILSMINLNGRSRQYIGSVFKKRVLNITSKTDYIAPGEHKWLFAYGVMAIPYRIFISLFIALYLSSKFFFLGVMLALFVVIQQIIFPIIKGFKNTYVVAKNQGERRRFIGVVTGVLLSALLLGVVMQFQYSITSSGVVFLNDSQQVRTHQNGIVRQVHAQDGEVVVLGQKVLEIENRELINSQLELRVDIEELTARYDQVRAKDTLQAADIFDQRKGLELELAELVKQVDDLTLTAPSGGIFVQPRQSDIEGSFHRRGDVVGFIFDDSPVIVTAIVDQVDIEKIRDHLAYISVMFKSNPGVVYTGKLLSVVPAASDQLPTRFLGSQEGGDVMVDSRDQSGTKTMKSNFLVQVSVEGAFNGSYRFANAHLKFVFEQTTVLNRLLDWMQVNWLRNSTLSR